MRLLLDEMYPVALAEALREAGIDAVTVSEPGLAGSSDPHVFEAARAGGYTVLTENVADFARIASDHVTTGEHHPGVLVALSSRFSRGASGRPTLLASILAVKSEELGDRVVYLERVAPGEKSSSRPVRKRPRRAR